MLTSVEQCWPGLLLLELICIPNVFPELYVFLLVSWFELEQTLNSIQLSLGGEEGGNRASVICLVAGPALTLDNYT